MKPKKSKKRIAFLAAAVAAGLCMPFAAACNARTNGADDYPFDDSDIIQKDYDYVVKIIGTKTQTLYLKSGDTLIADRPTNIPKKSGEKFVGWYADGESTEYDWTAPVTKDITIRAKFEKIGLTVANGTAFLQEDGGIVTGANDTLVITNNFERGAFSVDVTPVNTGNDCGVVFGAKPPETEKWWEDGAEYYTALINKDGVLLFASVNPWRIVAEKQLKGYDCTKTYNLKVAYNDGYAVIYVDGERILAAEIGDLAGTGAGVRAQIAGTVFGVPKCDPDDLPEPPNYNVGAYTVRNGQLKETTGGAVTTTEANTLAIFTDKQQPDRFSITMNNHEGGDDGIVFSLTDSGKSGYWEQPGTSYYFFFIDGSSKARLARVVGGWNEPFDSQGANVEVASDNGKFRLEVQIDGNMFTCYVNGKRAFAFTDQNKLTGTCFGVRAKVEGIEYTVNEV